MKVYVITHYDHWEYSGIAGVAYSRQAAEEAVAEMESELKSNCRCGKPRGAVGHEDCGQSAGYEIEESELITA
jgi:hypothetical protein